MENQLKGFVFNNVFSPEEANIIFNCGEVEVMRLTKDGMIYKGELITDGGEVYGLFKDWLKTAK